MTIDDFLARVRQRDIPSHPMGRIRLLAQELAEGAYEGCWPMDLYAFRGDVSDGGIAKYLEERWNNQNPSFGLLEVMGYLQWSNANSYLITKQAYELMGEAQPADVFISYRRKESSAFALLVLARLKAAGIHAFLDMSLVPGEEWQRGLKQRIESNDYVVALIGPDTLSSSEVVWELESAVNAGVTIIPIWHGGFTFRPGVYTLPPSVEQVLVNTQTIRVLEESAVGYNNAIVELLNRFGATP